MDFTQKLLLINLLVWSVFSC